MITTNEPGIVFCNDFIGNPITEHKTVKKNHIKTLIRIISEFFYKRENIDLYSDRVTTFGITTTKERLFWMYDYDKEGKEHLLRAFLVFLEHKSIAKCPVDILDGGKSLINEFIKFNNITMD